MILIPQNEVQLACLTAQLTWFSFAAAMKVQKPSLLQPKASMSKSRKSTSKNQQAGEGEEVGRQNITVRQARTMSMGPPKSKPKNQMIEQEASLQSPRTGAQKATSLVTGNTQRMSLGQLHNEKKNKRSLNQMAESPGPTTQTESIGPAPTLSDKQKKKAKKAQEILQKAVNQQNSNDEVTAKETEIQAIQPQAESPLSLKRLDGLKSLPLKQLNKSNAAEANRGDQNLDETTQRSNKKSFRPNLSTARTNSRSAKSKQQPEVDQIEDTPPDLEPPVQAQNPQKETVFTQTNSSLGSLTQPGEKQSLVAGKLDNEDSAAEDSEGSSEEEESESESEEVAKAGEYFSSRLCNFVRFK